MSVYGDSFAKCAKLRFFRLSPDTRWDIAFHLKLIQPGDTLLASKVFFDTVFERALEQEILDKLDRECAKAELDGSYLG